MVTVFFDIGDTLGTPTFSSDGRLEGFEIYPDARAVLEELKRRGLRLGILSNRGDEPAEAVNQALKGCGIYDFLDSRLIIYEKKVSPAPFRAAADLAGCAPEECVFVGENNEERSYALEAGFRVAPHPKLVLDVVNDMASGGRLAYVRVTLPTDQQASSWRNVLREVAIVPLRVTGNAPKRLYAIASGHAVTRLRELRFSVELLGKEGDPLATDLYLVRDDRETPTGFMAAQGQSAQFFKDRGEGELILSPSREGVYVAVPAGRSIEDFHFPGARHGHNEKLVPDMALLDPFEPATAGWAGNLMAAPAAEPSLSNEELEGFGEITPEAIRRYLDRYTGNIPLDEEAGITISSRHIQSKDNARVTGALVRDLKTIGGKISL